MAAFYVFRSLGLARASRDRLAGTGRVAVPSDCNVGLRSGEKRKSVKTAGFVHRDAFGDLLILIVELFRLE